MYRRRNRPLRMSISLGIFGFVGFIVFLFKKDLAILGLSALFLVGAVIFYLLDKPYLKMVHELRANNPAMRPPSAGEFVKALLIIVGIAVVIGIIALISEGYL